MLTTFNASFGAQPNALNRTLKKTPLFKGSNQPQDRRYITQDTEMLSSNYYNRNGSTQPISSDYYQQQNYSQQYQPMDTQSTSRTTRESSYAPTEISQDRGYTYSPYSTNRSTPIPANPNLEVYQSSTAWKKPASNQDHEARRADRYVENPAKFEMTPSPPRDPEVSSQQKRALIQQLAKAIRATETGHPTRTHHNNLQRLRDNLRKLGNASLINQIEREAAALARR